MEKLKIECCSLKDIINLTDKNHMSLLERCLSSRKFDIAQMLLNKGSMINVISNGTCNELHYLSANLETKESIYIAKQLVELNVDLDLQDKKYKNTPFWYLCQKALQKNNEDMNLLISTCMTKKPNINLANVAGNTVEKMIAERGNKELREIVLGG